MEDEAEYEAETMPVGPTDPARTELEPIKEEIESPDGRIPHVIENKPND